MYNLIHICIKIRTENFKICTDEMCSNFNIDRIELIEYETEFAPILIRPPLFHCHNGIVCNWKAIIVN